MASGYVKRYSTSLLFREMQIKTTLRRHLTAVRTAIIKKTETTRGGEDAEQREVSCTVGGNVNWFSQYEKQCGSSIKN